MRAEQGSKGHTRAHEQNLPEGLRPAPSEAHVAARTQVWALRREHAATGWTRYPLRPLAVDTEQSTEDQEEKNMRDTGDRDVTGSTESVSPLAARVREIASKAERKQASRQVWVSEQTVVTCVQFTWGSPLWESAILARSCLLKAAQSAYCLLQVTESTFCRTTLCSKTSTRETCRFVEPNTCTNPVHPD